MAEPVASAAPQIENAATKPKGILPGNLKNWAMIVGGTLVALFVLFNSGGSSAKDKKAAAAVEAAKPVVTDPSQARIQEYRKTIDIETRKLQAEQERLRQVQESLGMAANPKPAGALQTMYPANLGPNQMSTPQNTQAPAVDPIQADRQKREYASLFASSVALSYRPAAATGVAGAAAEPKLSKAVEKGSRDKDEQRPAFPASSLAALESIVSTPVAKSAATSKLVRVAEEEQTDPDPDLAVEKTGGKRTSSPAELRQAEGASHRLFEGTVIETVLTNRIAGDFSGPVNCLVSTNIYSHNRQHLLIPQGARVLGEVKRVSNFGQQRVAVFFHRLIMPDGFSVDLDRFQGLNQIGETGLKDQVNHHYIAIFGSSLALGAIAGFSQAGTSGGFTTSGIDSYRQGVSSSLSQSSQRILDKFLNELPTITIREGYRVKVYLAGDLLLPDYSLHRIPDDL